MNFVFLSSSVFSLMIFHSGCKSRSYNRDNASTKEAFGVGNVPQTMGVSPAFLNYDALKKELKGSRSAAWSDTFWPHFERGLSSRWLLQDANQSAGSLTQFPVSMYSYLEEFKKTVAKNDPNELAFLSTAEKYDLLTGKFEIPESYYVKIRDWHQSYADKEAPDTLLSLQKTLRKIAPVPDDYKSLIKGYVTDANTGLQKFQKYVLMGKNLAITDERQEDLSRYMPLTAEGWSNWYWGFENTDDEWTWMGLCHGWS